jgi:two-component system, sensor histidine kinase PdtaS
MTILSSVPDTVLRFPSPREVSYDPREQKPREMLTAELQASLAREDDLREERRNLLQRQDMLTQEFEHRLINGLQMISSLLYLQSRAVTPEAAAQLVSAARRVDALGRVHRRLHLLDHQKNVAFKQYLEHLCDDLASLLFQKDTGCSIAVEAAEDQIPTALGIPLGFIVNELVTNSAKYACGNISVRFDTTSPGTHALSVLDDGPGLPAGFDPARSKGLGMTIVRLLVQQIGGELHVSSGDNGRGTCFTVTFCSLTRVSAAAATPPATIAPHEAADSFDSSLSVSSPSGPSA